MKNIIDVGGITWQTGTCDYQLKVSYSLEGVGGWRDATLLDLMHALQALEPHRAAELLELLHREPTIIAARMRALHEQLARTEERVTDAMLQLRAAIEQLGAGD